MKKIIDFHANGKLLLTGEYLVLEGARALAFPVRFGQQIHIEETSSRVLEWESSDASGTWFEAVYDLTSLGINSANSKKTAIGLQKVLLAARRLNPRFLAGAGGWRVHVTANYPLEWGLGSSSTLCALVASWADLPVFELFHLISRGSGYDIACAGRQGLIFYSLSKGKPAITPARAGKALRDNTWFAYLGNKQDSATEVALFLKSQNYSKIDLMEISQLSSAICNAESPEELIGFADEHEFILSTILQRVPIAQRFPGFPGTVKSLGAWGGDFAMFISGLQPDVVVNHLLKLGLSNVFSYNDLAIKA